MPKSTLDNIPEEKRERVLREAALLFAEKGYPDTDMAKLARRAGISKGSIYTYFESKDELYLYDCRDGLDRSREAVVGGVDPARDIYHLEDNIFHTGVSFARAHPEYVSLYLSFSPSGMEFFARELSEDVEKPTADYLKQLIRDGIERGYVRDDLDVEHAAWLINNNYVMFLAALVSRHFRTRMTTYFEIEGELADVDIELHLDRTIRLIHDLLRPAGLSLDWED